MVTTQNRRDEIKKIDPIEILENNYIGHLSYIYRGRPFITPITFYYNKYDNTILCYSAEGHKIRAMRRNTHVSLSVSEIESINSWISILAHGEFVELSGSTAKIELHNFSTGIKSLIARKEHRELDFIREFSSKLADDDLAIIFKIKINEVSAKSSCSNHV